MKSGIKALVLLVNLAYPFAVLFGLRRLESPAKVFPFVLAFVIVMNVLANLPALKSRDYRVFYRIALMAVAPADPVEGRTGRDLGHAPERIDEEVVERPACHDAVPPQARSRCRGPGGYSTCTACETLRGIGR